MNDKEFKKIIKKYNTAKSESNRLFKVIDEEMKERFNLTDDEVDDMINIHDFLVDAFEEGDLSLEYIKEEVERFREEYGETQPNK